MEFKQIETFITVVEWNSFSDAAKSLYLSQPTVTNHVQQLEQELNTKLIYRTTKVFELTPAGREFYHYAKSIMRTVQNIEDTFQTKHLRTLNIGASSIPSMYLLPKFLKAYRKESPETKINIVQEDSLSTIDAVYQGRVNVGLVGTKTSNEQLHFEKLKEDQLVVVAPNTPHFQKYAHQRISIQKLFQEPIILREEGSGTKKESFKIFEEIGIQKNELHVVATVNDAQVVKKLMEMEMGISVVSALCVEEEVLQGKLISFPIPSVDAKRYFYFVYRKSTSWEEYLHTMCDFAKEIIAE